MRPLPDVEAPEFAPFWGACRERRLVVQRCETCGRRNWPPRPACPACGSQDLGWVGVEPTGSLYSWTVVHRSPLPGFAAIAPYVVAVVALADAPGLRMLGRLDGVPEGAGLRVGMALRVRFERVTEDVTLPLWAPATG